MAKESFRNVLALDNVLRIWVEWEINSEENLKFHTFFKRTDKKLTSQQIWRHFIYGIDLTTGDRVFWMEVKFFFAILSLTLTATVFLVDGFFHRIFAFFAKFSWGDFLVFPLKFLVCSQLSIQTFHNLS